MDKDQSTIHEDDDTMSLKGKSEASCYNIPIKTESSLNGPIRFSVNLKDKKPSHDLQGNINLLRKNFFVLINLNFN